MFGDHVCRGCKRFHHEVIEWNGYTDIQKETVWNRLESLKVLIMKSKISTPAKQHTSKAADQQRLFEYARQADYCVINKQTTDCEASGVNASFKWCLV